VGKQLIKPVRMFKRAPSYAVILGLLVLGLPLTDRAQESKPERPVLRISLEDAVQMGLRNSQDIRIASSQSRESATSITSARASLFPVINATFDYTRTLSAQTFALPPGFNLAGLPFGQANNYNFGVGYNQPLFRPGIFRGIEIAKQYYRSAQDQETETQLDIVLGICQGYYGAVLADRLADIARAQIDQLDAQLKDVRLQRQAGNASDLDVSRVEVNRENVAPQLSDALNARDQAILGLKRLIYLPVATDLVLTDQLSAEGFRPVTDGDIAELTAASVKQRAAVRAAQRLNTIRQAEIKQAKTAFWPTVDIIGNVGEQAFPSNLIPNRSEFQDNYTIGFRVSIPLFEGGQKIARVRAARERLTQSELQLEKLVLSVQTDVEEWRLKLKRAEALIESRARASQQAARVYELTDLSYRQGSSTHLDLTDARTNLRLARANEVQTVHDYYSAYLHLIRSVGVPAPNFVRSQSLSSHKPGSGTPSPSK
jgi:outer membrane protein